MVYTVASIFTDEIHWVFREQPIADHGIDTYVEVTKGNKPIGRLLALQIKSGKSFFKMTSRATSFLRRGSTSDLEASSTINAPEVPFYCHLNEVCTGRNAFHV